MKVEGLVEIHHRAGAMKVENLVDGLVESLVVIAVARVVAEAAEPAERRTTSAARLQSSTNASRPKWKSWPRTRPLSM